MQFFEREFLSSAEYRLKLIDSCGKRGSRFVVKNWELARASISIKKFVKMLEEKYNGKIIYMYSYERDVYLLEWV